ncbi:helix-turn-helix domain-containing protein [Bacteroides sp. 224]|uniref:helix-turn-helix domain-containing protein n=1 Tax=Bacteroides sp. 224 TaxID=2302936 RepID=UPI0013D5F453|nr:helix-turn-helix domain-containing protein [Bacteroides sp. 224]NDV65040.1 helix-turn-helix domain-containing protein [Bacteroides sp. 224]
MNGYKLTKRLKEVREKTPLSAIDQVLFHELASICNEKMWEETFNVRTSKLADALNISKKTIQKSRKELAKAGLIAYTTAANNQLGCSYSLMEKVINDEPTRVTVTPVTSSLIPVTREATSSVDPLTEEVITPVPPFSPIIYNKTIYIKHKDTAPKRKSTSLENKKSKQIDKRDLSTLDYPHTSEEFMAIWEELAGTAKWKTKKNGSLQRSLNKLAKYEEAFAIEQMERAIECNWMGVVFPNTDKYYEEWKKAKNDEYKRNNQPEKKSAGIISFEF